MKSFKKQRDGVLTRQSLRIADLLRRAIKESFDSEQIAAAWFEANPAGGEITPELARAWARATVMPNHRLLQTALQEIYATGYVLGEDLALAQYARLTVKSSPSEQALRIAFANQWDKWKAGNRKAELLLRQDRGIQQLLNRVQIVIRSIEETSLNRLGTILADALAGGKGVDQVAREIRGMLSDPERAVMIANTEMRRATSTAERETWTGYGVKEVEWSEVDGCEYCQENADYGPVPIGMAFPTGDTEPPAHPNCRCSLNPYVDEDNIFGSLNEGTAEFDVYEEKALRKYSEDQERDESGRFGSGSGASESSSAKVELSTPQKEIYDKLRRTGTVDSAKTLHNAALGFGEAAFVAEDLDLNSVYDKDIAAVSEYIAAQSQEQLERDGFGEQFSVWRAGDLGEGVISATTREGGLRTFGEATEYIVNRSDVLTYGEGLLGRNQTFDEKEIHILSTNLKPA